MLAIHITIQNLPFPGSVNLVESWEVMHDGRKAATNRHKAPRISSRSIYFLTKLRDRFGFCAIPLAGGCGGAGPPPPNNPFCLDLGFSGDSTPDLEGGLIVPPSGSTPPPGGPMTFLLPRPLPPKFLPAPNPGGPPCEEPGLELSRSFANSSESGEESAPRFCLLAFSCLA